MKTSQKHVFEEFDLLPTIGSTMEELFDWLQVNELVEHKGTYDSTKAPVNTFLSGDSPGDSHNILAISTSRSVIRNRSDDLKRIREEWKSRTPSVGNKDFDTIWLTLNNPNSAVRQLSIDRLPADALAFYRPFHFPPFDQWGIYLLIEPLLNYHHHLTSRLNKLAVFTPSSVMALVLFEIFHHEFFHHMVESTATTLEIILAATGQNEKIYLNYWDISRRVWSDHPHPHAPLEEALANAYAWNSLSFISRVKVGYKDSAVKFYQKAIEKHWTIEPPGYREARHYTGGAYQIGASELLDMMLNNPYASEVPLMKLAESVMPSGHTAFVQKPDIPTYLVGRDEAMKTFEELVPAPNETYTNLFWPDDFSELDKFIKDKREELKKLKEAQKSMRKVRG